MSIASEFNHESIAVPAGTLPVLRYLDSHIEIAQTRVAAVIRAVAAGKNPDPWVKSKVTLPPETTFLEKPPGP